MKRALTLATIITVGWLNAILAAQPASSQPSRVVAYFPEWSVSGGKYHVQDIPAEKLTHVLYAFAQIADGKCAASDEASANANLPELVKLKARNAKLQILVSVGGWTGSKHFSDVALTEQSRRVFANSCADFAGKWKLDGVDIDWEFPTGGGLPDNVARPEDRHNFTLLLAELRAVLNKRGEADHKHYALTIAAGATPMSLPRMELDKVHPLLDWINLMCYDYAGSWSDQTGFNAALFPDKLNTTNCIATAVRAFQTAGVPNDKIVVGVPFYAVKFAGVNGGDSNGLYQSFDKADKASGQQLNYRDIEKQFALTGPLRHWNDVVKAPWFYDPATKTMITYDDAESLRIKSKWVHDQKLGGVMIWEITGDTEQHALLDALRPPAP